MIAHDARALKYPSAPTTHSVMWQMAAMWLYETKLHWRRRPLKIAFLTLMLTASISTWMIVTGLSQSSLRIVDVSGMALEHALLVKGVLLMTTSMTLLAFMQTLILPLMLADSVALDESDQMMELLRSTPLPAWAYLVGKVGGMWLAGMSAIVFAMLIVAITNLFMVGAYNPLPMLDGWLVLSAPVLLFNGGFTVLIGATQPTRRRAVIVVLGVLFLSGYLGGIVPEGPLTALVPFNGAFVMQLFGISESGAAIYAPVLTLSGVTTFIVGRGVVFLATALIVGAWWTLRWSDMSLRPKPAAASAVAPIAASQQH